LQVFPLRGRDGFVGLADQCVDLRIRVPAEGARDADRGIPRIASPGVGGRILRTLQELSRPFGTEILIKGEIGFIAVQ
jgi:hypothetical protein